MPRTPTLLILHFDVTLEGDDKVYKVESTYYPALEKEQVEIFDSEGTEIHEINPLYERILAEYLKEKEE